jgi:hypothetical protein
MDIFKRILRTPINFSDQLNEIMNDPSLLANIELRWQHDVGRGCPEDALRMP